MFAVGPGKNKKVEEQGRKTKLVLSPVRTLSGTGAEGMGTATIENTLEEDGALQELVDKKTEKETLS